MRFLPPSYPATTGANTAATAAAIAPKNEMITIDFCIWLQKNFDELVRTAR
jgi:hypothetical protein